MGEGLIIRLFNDNAHIGAVAVAEYDDSGKRTSASVLTRLGHKEDGIALKTAHYICKEIKKARLCHCGHSS
jgi:hypothetical protein